MNAHNTGATSRSGGDVYDPVPSARSHARYNGLGAQECRLEIDRHSQIEIRLGNLVDATTDRYSGVVDEQIDGPQFCRDLGDHGLHGGAHGYVCSYRNGLAATRLY